MSPLKVLSIGGSRNIGYHAAVRLLAKGAIVTFLLRNADVFANDTAIQQHLTSGTARIVHGDALVKEDVARAWEEAAKGEGEAKVDVLLFTVGGVPHFRITQGAVITPFNLSTQCILNALETLPSPDVKIIVLSSTGLTRASHARLPLLLKPLYAYLLALPHRDKLGMEKAIAHCAGHSWDPQDDPKNLDEIMGGADWQSRLPAAGSLHNILVIRAALLVDSEAQADKSAEELKGKQPYRVQSENEGGYTVSRKDVAHFIVEGALTDWQKLADKVVSIAY